MNLIIDTNILILALIKDSLTRKIIFTSHHNLCFPELQFSKLIKYKSLILKKSQMNENIFKTVLTHLISRINIIQTKTLMPYLPKAKNIMQEIDPKDVVFIAAALAKNYSIWSDDKHFSQQKIIAIITTKELSKLFLK